MVDNEYGEVFPAAGGGREGSGARRKLPAGYIRDTAKEERGAGRTRNLQESRKRHLWERMSWQEGDRAGTKPKWIPFLESYRYSENMKSVSSILI